MAKICNHLDCGVLFTKTQCILQGPSMKRPLELGNAQGGLYLSYVKAKDQASLSTACISGSSFPSVSVHISENKSSGSVSCNSSSIPLLLFYGIIGWGICLTINCTDFLLYRKMTNLLFIFLVISVLKLDNKNCLFLIVKYILNTFLHWFILIYGVLTTLAATMDINTF